MEIHEGGCLCGEIRYRVTGSQIRGAICHCETCRKWSGAPFLSWVILKKVQLEWLKGEPQSIRATPAVVRKFCSGCGTPLSFEFSDSSPIIGVTTGSLDRPGDFPPSRHNWAASEVPWLRMVNGLPRNPGDAGDERITS
jgi:hypothetical protein